MPRFEDTVLAETLYEHEMDRRSQETRVAWGERDAKTRNSWAAKAVDVRKAVRGALADHAQTLVEDARDEGDHQARKAREIARISHEVLDYRPDVLQVRADDLYEVLSGNAESAGSVAYETAQRRLGQHLRYGWPVIGLAEQERELVLEAITVKIQQLEDRAGRRSHQDDLTLRNLLDAQPFFLAPTVTVSREDLRWALDRLVGSLPAAQGFPDGWTEPIGRLTKAVEGP